MSSLLALKGYNETLYSLEHPVFITLGFVLLIAADNIYRLVALDKQMAECYTKQRARVLR
jgi:hypothetical protein